MTGLSDEPQSWPVHEVEHIWQGAAPFSVRRDIISAPDKPEETFGRLVLEHPGAVVVLAVDEQERVLVLHQYRHPASTGSSSCRPACSTSRGRTPWSRPGASCARRGCVEAGRWTHLFTTYSSPGLSSERIGYYLAQDLTPAADRGGFEPDHEEADMTLEWVPVDDLLAGVREGRVTDGPTAQAVLGYMLFHRREEAGR